MRNNAGFWEFPGRKRVEAGETSEQALRREIQEARHGVQAAFSMTRYLLPAPPLTCIWIVISARWASLRAYRRPGIHSELRWLAQNELLDVQWLPRSSSSEQRSGTTSLCRSTCLSRGRATASASALRARMLQV